MKLTFALVALISASALAQQQTNAPAAAPESSAPAAPSTNAPPARSETKKAPKKKAEKKAPAKKKEAALKSVPLVAGPATVSASNVNVRGQAKLNSEVLTRLTKGQSVTVLEEVTLKNSGPDEPSAWAKILIPAGAKTWVNSAFIDTTNQTVIPRKLKLRAGPGEQYSVLGMLKHGDAVKEAGAKGEWLQIEPPADAYAFVAAEYLKQEAPAPAAPVVTPPETPPVTSNVAESQPAVPAKPETPVTAPAETAPANPPSVASTTPPEPPPPRIVEREGVVRGVRSIQAPTEYCLVSLDTKKTINFLYTTSHELNLSRYKGLRVIVTGEEGLDERWPHTPLITIQRIQPVGD